MGLVTIISMIATYALASRFVQEPEIAALIVIAVTVLFLIIGNLVITGFNRVAETNRMKSEFISLVSHQLRSPLSIFRWTIDVLERNAQKISEEPLRSSNGSFIDTLRKTSDNMIVLVNSLLEVTRIEARTFVLREELFDLGKMTRDIAENYRKYAEASKVAIRLEVPELPQIKADRERIAIVIQNLIDNAVRYTEKAGTITIGLEKEEKTILWQIKDQGIGIPAAQQKFIFQKFFRAQRPNPHVTTQTHGTGIGLYISKEIIESSGGKIGFISEEGKGTTFWFRLPIKA
ncbi:hypothetical protein A2783_02045 [Microgenomates group bacterium RIFCSPHIGHO2_01_FULL_45_11]|nr:MAG: hypothetical protein A2783_02045 [Microgenomates group bacterium RIFCSPHIGHO2_01_FULL_45_11]